MTLLEYQQAAARFAVYPHDAAVLYPALGLGSEAGEVLGAVKRILRDDGGQLTEERREQLAKELGDVLWYLAVLATDLQLSLDDVAAINLAKLEARRLQGLLHGEGGDREAAGVDEETE